MGLCIIATLDPSAWGDMLLVILMVAAGIGAVIFVHELGHFLVAKACGVKCEKFMIGFDIGGIKISRKWGETEYGIGILPMGGYVKMLGQDDNPANIAEQVRESQVRGETVDAKEITGPDGRKYLVDRRSYLAKSVPQRMAIISAGVVMNIIFAFIFAAIAYKLGVPYNPSVVSQTAPGSPAWRADVRPGDEVVQMGDIEEPSFIDLKGGVTLADLEHGLKFVIRRGDELLEKQLVPEQEADGGFALVGISSPSSLRLHREMPVNEFSVAAKAEPAFEAGDEVVAVDGQPVADYAAYSAVLANKPDQPLVITVRRDGVKPKDDPFGPLTGGKMVEVKVDRQPMMRLGLAMQVGKITAVQENSPAEEKSIKAGDFIEQIWDAADDAASADDKSKRLDRDPMTMPEHLRRLAAEDHEVSVTLRRGDVGGEGKQPTETLNNITLRKRAWLEGPMGPNDPVSSPALGIAYRVLSVVGRVEPDSPAEKAEMKAGDVVTAAELIFPEGMKDKPEVAEIEFGKGDAGGDASWPWFVEALQALPEGTKVKLTFIRGDKEQEAVLTPDAAEGYFVAERGLQFEWIERIRIAENWNEAVERGWKETTGALTMVYRFLGKLGGQVPITALGGPITIAKAAGYSAFEGVGKLLVFLTMLSANLAVINFLPIPVLDGGHMVFLAWEGIRGKPASEKFVMAMHTAGFVFIVTLMLFVISLDFGWIPRNL